MKYDPLNDVGILRETLYDVVKKNAKGLSSDEVIDCLKEISETTYAAGMDEALRAAESRIKKWDNIADAWDLIWLTVYALELAKRKGKV